MEKPESRIGSVVQALLLTLREHIGYESIPDVMSKGANNGTRLDVAPCSQGEPFEADHGVATPVCEPVVTGYDAMECRTRWLVREQRPPCAPRV